CGYDAMQLRMSEPVLRSHMETQLKLVALGQRRKEEVVRELIGEMRQTYLNVMEQANCLEREVRRLWEEKEEHRQRLEQWGNRARREEGDGEGEEEDDGDEFRSRHGKGGGGG